MKILQVITSLHIGGAEKLIVDIVPRLIDKGHTVDVVLFDGSITNFIEELTKYNCKIFRFSNGGSAYNPLYILKLRKIITNYDIIHTHNTSPQLFVAIANICKKKVLCTTEHNTSNRRRSWSWYKPIDRWMYNQYSCTICISDKAQENIEVFLPNLKTQIRTIYNGIDVAKFHNATSDETLAKRKFTIAMVAGFRPQKDQDTLIKAMALLPRTNTELWLVGDGERKSTLMQLTQELGLEDNIKFLGIKSNIPEILHAADVIVMSSHYEGLSLSSIEGMSVNKPFIASNVDGLHEIVKGYGVLVEHENAEALAAEITKLMDNHKYYQQIAAKCYERAQQFDISKTVDGYLNIYKSIIS